MGYILEREKLIAVLQAAAERLRRSGNGAEDEAFCANTENAILHLQGDIEPCTGE